MVETHDKERNIRKIVIKTRAKTGNGADSASLGKIATMPISLADDSSRPSGPVISTLVLTIPHQAEPVSITLADADQVIGRGEDCDIPLLLENVSRRHACIYRYRREYVIEDLNSTNGTFVNDERIDHCVLRNKDTIRIGNATMQLIQTHE